jgi:AcrR family transcriptional regulator
VRAFAEKGFHATTTRDLAEAAGVSSTALYVHHKSKEELLHLITRGSCVATLRLIRDGVASAAEPVAQLGAVVRGLVEHHVREHRSARVANYELSALTPEHREEILGLRQAIEEELRTLIARGVGAGAFTTSDASLTAGALLSLVADIGRWYPGAGGPSPESIADHYTELALRLVACLDAGEGCGQE